MPIQHQAERPAAGLKHRIRITMDMDEPGVRKHLQQQANPASVRRRFEDQRTIVFQRQLLEENLQRGLPLREFIGCHRSQGQIFLKSLSLPWKDPGQAGRFETGYTSANSSSCGDDGDHSMLSIGLCGKKKDIIRASVASSSKTCAERQITVRKANRQSWAKIDATKSCHSASDRG